MTPSNLLRRVVGLATVFAACATAAHAQMMVYDPSVVAKLIEEAQTGISQLQQLQQQVSQGERLFTSLSQLSNVNAIARELSAPGLRAVLPDADSFIAAARGDLSTLGQIGQQALAIRQANRLYTPNLSDLFGTELEAAGARAARDLATGQTVGNAGAARLQGLQQLQAALDTAANPRAVLDLQARIGAEQAMIANDQMRLQGLAMSQDAEARIQQQRLAERAAAARDARLAAYRAAFP